MSNIRQDISVINERLKKIYILYRKLKDSQGGGGGIESVEVNGSKLPIVNSGVNITVPTKTSDLTNDLNFVPKTYVDSHIINKNNPHNVTKEQLNLGNVNNTSDLNKPISTATQTELNKKLDSPTTNNTNEYVILGDGSTTSKSEFGKVDKVMGVEPDADKNVDISGIETNWTNSNQQWSGLADKSADATFNKVMVLDGEGKAGTKDASDLGYIPLSGTKEGKPISGYFKIDDEYGYVIHKGSDNAELGESGTILNIGDEIRMDAMEADGDTYRKAYYKISPYSLDSYFAESSDTVSTSYTKIVNSTSISEGIGTVEGVSFSKDYDTYSNDYTRSISSDGNNTTLTQTDTSFSIEFNNQPFIAIQPADIVTKALLNADTLIDILTNSTPEKITQIKTLLGV